MGNCANAELQLPNYSISQFPMPPGSVEIRDVAPGLWVWRQPHPCWRPGQGWEPIVASTCVESRGEILLLDPLAPPDDAYAFWHRLDAHPPSAIVVPPTSWWPSTTDAGATKHRCGCPNNEPLFLPTPLRHPEASCASGRRLGTRSASCLPSANCLNFPSSA